MLVGYMRVSSADDRQSVDLQRDALIAAGVDERHLYSDKASGARDDRPGLKACLAFLKRGDGLVVWKLDRLGRSLPHLLSIITELKERGIAFRSLTEAMDTATPHGELLFSLFGALAQYERALTRERVMAGLAAAKRRGRNGGRPPTIDGERMDQITAALDAGASKASEAVEKCAAGARYVWGRNDTPRHSDPVSHGMVIWYVNNIAAMKRRNDRSNRLFKVRYAA